MDIVLVLKINKMSSIRKLGFRWTKCNQSLQCLSLCCLNKELFRNVSKFVNLFSCQRTCFVNVGLKQLSLS